MDRELRYKFLTVLFDEEDRVAWGDEPKTCNKPLDPIPGFLDTEDMRFCINGLKEWRNTPNITQFTSLLFECDDKRYSTEEQAEMFNQSGIPYTTMVESGNKSIHVIVRFSEPMKSKAHHDKWWKAISLALRKWGIVSDDRARLVTQLTRMPGSTRKDTGQVQKLIHIGERIEMTRMKEWLALNHVEIEPVKEREPLPPYIPGTNDSAGDLKKWNRARSWTDKKNGAYSTYMTTGAHNWLFDMGMNSYKVDLDIGALQNLSRIEWGEDFKGTNGSGKVAASLKLGWDYAYKNQFEKSTI